MHTFPLIIMIGTWEIIAIIAVIVLLFGGKKIPELMKGIGKGVKSFKEGMTEVDKEVQDAVNSNSDDNQKKE